MRPPDRRERGCLRDEPLNGVCYLQITSIAGLRAWIIRVRGCVTPTGFADHVAAIDDISEEALDQPYV